MKRVILLIISLSLFNNCNSPKYEKSVDVSLESNKIVLNIKNFESKFNIKQIQFYSYKRNIGKLIPRYMYFSEDGIFDINNFHTEHKIMIHKDDLEFDLITNELYYYVIYGTPITSLGYFIITDIENVNLLKNEIIDLNNKSESLKIFNYFQESYMTK